MGLGELEGGLLCVGRGRGICGSLDGMLQGHVGGVASAMCCWSSLWRVVLIVMLMLARLAEAAEARVVGADLE